MVVGDKTIVALIYELFEGKEDGMLIEKVEKENPFNFLFGSGNLLEEFEGHLKGLNAGDSFNFLIKSENAYGQFSEENIRGIDISILKQDGILSDDMLQVGKMIPMQDQEGSNMNGVVLEVSDKNIKLDFNHPMAGKDLFFKGEIIEVREASDDEISHGHVHGPDGHHH